MFLCYKKRVLTKVGTFFAYNRVGVESDINHLTMFILTYEYSDIKQNYNLFINIINFLEYWKNIED